MKPSRTRTIMVAIVLTLTGILSKPADVQSEGQPFALKWQDLFTLDPRACSKFYLSLKGGDLAFEPRKDQPQNQLVIGMGPRVSARSTDGSQVVVINFLASSNFDAKQLIERSKNTFESTNPRPGAKHQQVSGWVVGPDFTSLKDSGNFELANGPLSYLIGQIPFDTKDHLFGAIQPKNCNQTILIEGKQMDGKAYNLELTKLLLTGIETFAVRNSDYPHYTGMKMNASPQSKAIKLGESKQTHSECGVNFEVADGILKSSIKMQTTDRDEAKSAMQDAYEIYSRLKPKDSKADAKRAFRCYDGEIAVMKALLALELNLEKHQDGQDGSNPPAYYVISALKYRQVEQLYAERAALDRAIGDGKQAEIDKALSADWNHQADLRKAQGNHQ